MERIYRELQDKMTKIDGVIQASAILDNVINKITKVEKLTFEMEDSITSNEAFKKKIMEEIKQM